MSPKPVAYLPGQSGERALRARLLLGEERAMADLYAMHARRLLRILTRYLRNAQLAEDALQETFAAAFRNLGSLQNVSNLEAWLTRIAVRKVLNMRRSSARRARVEQQPAPAPETPDPAARDLAQDVLRLLQEMEPEKRLVLLLVCEGYTAAEIAESLEAPRSTILSRISRSRAELARRCAAAGLEIPGQLELDEPAP